MVYQPSTNVPLISNVYQTLYTFQPSSVLWPGSSGFIFVQVFGQLLCALNTSQTVYIRLLLSGGSGLALVKAETIPITYSLTWAGSITTSNNLIVEARNPYPDPTNPPQLVSAEESTQATQIFFIY